MPGKLGITSVAAFPTRMAEPTDAQGRRKCEWGMNRCVHAFCLCSRVWSVRACMRACVRARASVRARACVHGCWWVCARVRARLGEGTTARFVRKPSLEAVYDAVASRCWWPSCVRWKLTSVTFATLHDGLSTSTHECRSAATRRAPSRSMRGEGWLQWRPVECAVLRLFLQQCFEYLRALPAGAHCCEHPSRLCARGLGARMLAHQCWRKESPSGCEVC